MKYDEALILVERITKAQQEAGQREMMNRNTVFTRLKEYLDNKWNDKDSPLNKHQLKQKLNEYKRFEEIKRFGKNYSKKFVYFNKNPESDEGKKEKKSDINTRKFIKQTLDKKSEWLIKNGSNEINYDISNDMPIVMRSKNNKRTEEYNLTNQKDFDTYEKLVAEHEYGHLYNWLKHYIETGKKEELPPTFTKKDRRIGSDEEGRAEEYAFNNVYRKDRRDILKNSNYTLADLEKSNNELEKGPYIGLDKAADIYRKNPDKANNIKRLLNDYSNKVYNAGRYNKAKNIVNILKSIEKERGNNK